jgi:hypothetical protein
MKTRQTEIDVLENLIQQTIDDKKYPYRFLYFTRDRASTSSDFSYADYHCKRNTLEYIIQIWHFAQKTVGVNLRTIDYELCKVTHEDFDSIESLILKHPELI